jgi:hypothetical protein
MPRIVITASLLAAFGAGCVASQATLNTAHAEDPPQRWDYICVDSKAGVGQSANRLGREGWEMAAAAGAGDSMLWCFKRKAK